MRAFAQSIVETVRQPLLLVDGSLQVQFANQAFCDNFLISQSDTIGRVLFDLSEGEWNVPRLRAVLEDVISGQAFEGFELRQESPRLGQRILLLNARQVFRDDDRGAMIFLAIEDVTHRVNAQDELHRLNRELEDRVRERTAELETANKELEAFCYSVSHDLRAPLRALDGFSEELLRSYSDRLDEKGQHYLRRVRSGTQRMGQLIDDLLQLSRLSRGEMKRERVDLSALAEAIAADLQQREPGRHVTIEIQTGLVGLGDPGLLKIVLENLLGNAWKFTGKKEAATISVGQTEHHGSLAFFVRDNGAGFDMNHAGKLFGAFQRLHPQRDFPGNGIGLATVQRVVHRHGGHVFAESPPGQGATFYFTLPQKAPA